MNWILEAYSNVYNAALMQDVNHKSHAADANSFASAKPSAMARLFGRR